MAISLVTRKFVFLPQLMSICRHPAQYRTFTPDDAGFSYLLPKVNGSKSQPPTTALLNSYTVSSIGHFRYIKIQLDSEA